MLSRRGSMKGWSNGTWFQKNKDALKTLVAGLFGIVGAWASTVALPAWAAALPGLVIGFLSRYVLDRIDFWLSDVEVPDE